MQFIYPGWFSISGIFWLFDEIRLIKVRVIGIPIITRVTGKGISLLNTLAKNIPIDDAENAVRLYATFVGSNFIYKGTLCFFSINVKGI